jgi:hypothetical protein
MTDVEFTRAVERGEIANKDFRHAAHLHVAWTYLCESETTDEAATKMRNTLRKFAANAGAPEKYHETMTLFWVYFLATMRVNARSSTLEQIVATNPRLLEKNFPLEYYSAERLFGDCARNSWVPPDLKARHSDEIAICPSGASSHSPDRPLSGRSA